LKIGEGPYTSTKKRKDVAPGALVVENLRALGVRVLYRKPNGTGGEEPIPGWEFLIVPARVVH
jgi:hypothetical protein